jgi:hypothetical protein
MIVALARAKQAVADADTSGLWRHTFPRLAASSQSLEQVESVLGENLDPLYRSFLEHAGGWPSFYQAIDLFGPAELTGGPEHDRAEALLREFPEDHLAKLGLRRGDVRPIAASRDDIDVFVMVRPALPTHGVILWLAADVVDQFENFAAFFSAIIAYHELETEALREIASA